VKTFSRFLFARYSSGVKPGGIDIPSRERAGLSLGGGGGGRLSSELVADSRGKEKWLLEGEERWGVKIISSGVLPGRMMKRELLGPAWISSLGGGGGGGREDRLEERRDIEGSCGKEAFCCE
jgi:hypothetical protein